MKVLIITKKGEYIEKEIKNKLDVLQDIVGGYIEYVDLSQDGLTMIVNEEGKIYDLEYNLGATLLYDATHIEHDIILGDVIILRDKDGKNVDIKKEDIDIIKKIILEELGGVR